MGSDIAISRGEQRDNGPVPRRRIFDEKGVVGVDALCLNPRGFAVAMSADPSPNTCKIVGSQQQIRQNPT